MKVIDLLQRIANGEEVPKKFMFEDREFYLQSKDCWRCDDAIFEECFILEDLNKEVEIIEEDKKIEKLIIGKDDVAWCEGNMKTDEEMVDIVLEIKVKIQRNNRLNKIRQQVIDELFELKDMIYKPETREINFDVQRKISSMIVKLGGDKE